MNNNPPLPNSPTQGMMKCPNPECVEGCVPSQPLPCHPSLWDECPTCLGKGEVLDDTIPDSGIEAADLAARLLLESGQIEVAPASVDGKKLCVCGVHNDPNATTCRACGVILGREVESKVAVEKTLEEIYMDAWVSFPEREAGSSIINYEAAQRQYACESIAKTVVSPAFDEGFEQGKEFGWKSCQDELSALRSAMKEGVDLSKSVLEWIDASDLFQKGDGPLTGRLRAYVAAALAPMEGK